MPVRLDSISTNVSTAKCFHHTSTISALLVIKCEHPMVPLFVLVQLKKSGDYGIRIIWGKLGIVLGIRGQLEWFSGNWLII